MPPATGARQRAGRRGARRPRRAWAGSRPASRDRGKRLAHLALERLEGGGEGGRPADDHERGARRCRGAGRPKRLTQTPPRAVTLYGIAQLSAHGEPHARWLVGLAPEHDERRTVDAFAPLEEQIGRASCRERV